MEHIDPLPSARKTSTGWSAIEDYVHRHDSSMVKDYADDIDTLLVFAGLFSAVLTAFVVETYTMLQPDNTQTTNQLLAEILSTQIRGTQTAQSDSTVPAFVPSAAARWINTLFFLSLVFSLAAALFGILVKQWLREFMRWNSPLASPRENVLVRQIRFEAWEDWNVAATISSIPALLELAMILFLSGIVILLWTLDSVVAIIVTVASALFMGAVSAFTLLPIFFRRCPYKSPTAWACVILADLVLSIGTKARRFCSEITSIGARNAAIDWDWRIWMVVNGSNGSNIARDWRERERTFRMSDMFHGNMINSKIHRAMEEVIHLEKTGLDESGAMIEEPKRGFSRIQMSMDGLQDLNEVSILFRALSWVYKASDDAQIRTHIAESTNTIHTRHLETLESRAIMNTSNWCLMWALQTGNIRHPAHAIFSPNEELAGIKIIHRKVREMWTREHARTLGGPRIIDRIRERVYYGAIDLQTPDAATATLLAYLIDSDLLSSLRSLQRVVENTRNMVIPAAMGRFILELLSVLGCIHSNRHIPISNIHLRGVQYIINSKELKQTLDIRLPGLRSSALLLACRLAKVKAEDGVFSVVTDGNRMSSLSYAVLIDNYFTAAVEDYDIEDRHIFVLLTTEWIMHLHSQTETHEHFRLRKSVVSKMADVTEYSLRLLTPNCGCYFGLPWILGLWSARDQHFSSPLIPEGHFAYIRLIHALEKMYARGLITSLEERHLRELSASVHEIYPALCGDEECQFYAGVDQSSISDVP